MLQHAGRHGPASIGAPNPKDPAQIEIELIGTVNEQLGRTFKLDKLASIVHESSVRSLPRRPSSMRSFES